MSKSREHQVVWGSPSVWQNEVTITDIHEQENRAYGYCTLDQITRLVQHSLNPHEPIWGVVGWVRTTTGGNH